MKRGKEASLTPPQFPPPSLQASLASTPYCEFVVTGHSLARTEETLKSKQKQLERERKGNIPFEGAALIQELTEKHYSNGAFGCNSPQALIYTLRYNNYLRFELRCGKEQRDLKCGDVVLKKNTKDKECLELNTERQTKARADENHINRR